MVCFTEQTFDWGYLKPKLYLVFSEIHIADSSTHSLKNQTQKIPLNFNQFPDFHSSTPYRTPYR